MLLLRQSRSIFGFPAYSDTLGTREKSHCKRSVTLSNAFKYIIRFLLGAKKVSLLSGVSHYPESLLAGKSAFEFEGIFSLVRVWFSL